MLVRKVDTKEQLGDLFTKPLVRDVFQCLRPETFDVNLAHSFAKCHDVNPTDFISRRFIWQELNPHAQFKTPSVGS